MARGESFFDDLARGLADGSVTRGKALRLMGAALLGGTLGSLGIDGEAGADPPGCKRNGKTCKKDTQCCSGNCVNSKCAACPSETTPCGTECCQTGATCVDGTCCPEAQVCDTGTTLACCAEGEQCGVDGVCGPACVSDGGSCSSGSDCCSGLVCKGRSGQGTCVASCIPPNAIPCDTGGAGVCPPQPGCGGCVREHSTGVGYCASLRPTLGCTTSCDCPTGQFCSQFSSTGSTNGTFCAVAC
jgi:hypothetical protein